MVEKVKHELYDGEIEMIFYPSKHWYKIGKRFVPSVTSITGLLDKPFLLYRAVNCMKDYLLDLPAEQRTDQQVIEGSKQHRIKKEEAADIGSQIHERIENWIKDKDMSLPEDQSVANGVLAFLQWVDEHDVEFIESERLIYSKKLDYTGTLDAIAIIDGKRHVIDFKSSNGFYPDTYGLQIGAYKQAYEEESGHTGCEMTCIWFDKETGEFKVYTLTEMYRDLITMFNGLVKVRHARKEVDKSIRVLFPKKKK